MINSRTPVIVGVGQITNRDVPGPSPVELLSLAVEMAVRDTGRPKILKDIDQIAVVRMSTQRLNTPGVLLAQLLGVRPNQTVSTKHGGQNPQILVNRAAKAIREGSADLVVIGGGEAQRTLSHYHRIGEVPNWPKDVASNIPDVSVGLSLRLGNDVEASVGLKDPVHYYALFETALALKSGRSLAEQTHRAAKLWSRFSEVASGNVHAAIQQPMSLSQIAEPGQNNRMISWPYTKFMSANSSVDQAAALIICSAERARSIGVPIDRWVFIHGCIEGNETSFVSNRAWLHSSELIKNCGASLLGSAGISADEIEYIDIYSCFPSAVQIAANALGISIDRQLTITGGLTFFGGPWNNYVSHSIATMVDLLRHNPENFGLCTATGGALTKHGMGLYSCRPKNSNLEVIGIGGVEEDPMRTRQGTVPLQGEVDVEAVTVPFGPDGPERVIVAGLLPSGERVWASSVEHSFVSEVMAGNVPNRMTLASTNLAL